MLFKKRKTYFGWTFISSDLPNFRFKNFWISAVLHFVYQWVGWEETKLLHFSIWRLFDALTILEHNLYQFMAITLRYVTILKFIYRILKPIFLWNFYCWSFNFWSIEGWFAVFRLYFLFYVEFYIKKPKIENIYLKVAKKTPGKNANIRHRWSARSYECKKIATAATSTGFMTHFKDLAQSVMTL